MEIDVHHLGSLNALDVDDFVGVQDGHGDSLTDTSGEVAQERFGGLLKIKAVKIGVAEGEHARGEREAARVGALGEVAEVNEGVGETPSGRFLQLHMSGEGGQRHIARVSREGLEDGEAVFKRSDKIAVAALRREAMASVERHTRVHSAMRNIIPHSRAATLLPACAGVNTSLLCGEWPEVWRS